MDQSSPPRILLLLISASNEEEARRQRRVRMRSVREVLVMVMAWNFSAYGNEAKPSTDGARVARTSIRQFIVFAKVMYVSVLGQAELSSGFAEGRRKNESLMFGLIDGKTQSTRDTARVKKTKTKNTQTSKKSEDLVSHE